MTTAAKSLPVILPSDTGQRFSCRSCTRCCRDLVVDLTEGDRRRIDAGRWNLKLDAAPYVRLRGRWVLNKDPQGRCVFLAADGLCRIHTDQGFNAKPLACRLFPFTLAPAGRSARAGWRFDCPTVARSDGAPVTAEKGSLGRLARELLEGRRSGPDEVQLKPGLAARPGEVSHLIGVLDRWMGDSRRPPTDRLRGAISLTATLIDAQLDAVREDRFVELVDLLGLALPSEIAANVIPPPSPRQASMLRQLAFAHTGHVRFEDMRAGLWRKLILRRTHLRVGRRFRRGRGSVPPVSGDPVDPVTFADVDRVRPDDGPSDGLHECVVRYLRSSLATRSCFGPSYYGWAVLDGLAALWMRVAVVGWWARYFAAVRHVPSFGLEELVRALGVVDAGAGRIPVLGSNVERLRLRFLQSNQGIASLVDRYLPWPAGQACPNTASDPRP